ncbi:MAG: aminomethyl-transferring glycine dehydrogenase subunit GcvPA [Candidatus Saganbacteria bacterium]|nr:aminomethyl-transferring glycine dehydrogenase subunit GcvPA [Candidatus Saganbacteria bacterium]
MSYIANTTSDQRKMMEFLGISSIDELFKNIPDSVLFKKELSLPGPLNEMEVLDELAASASKNIVGKASFLGAGSYNHFIPSVVKHICSRSEFYTAYTPYQAEASQGTLQAIFEYQSMICNLTGMDVANASMYDGATAMAEAALLACAVTKRSEIVVSKTVHPAYREVLKTYANGADKKVIEIPIGTGNWELGNGNACVIVGQPDFFGCVVNLDGLADKIHQNGSLFIVSVDPISLGILKPPGEYGADIVVGEGQSLGNPQNFGGPGLGLFAVKEKYLRNIPGRLVGETVDKDGKRAFCLTLQTREQHIRRERAGSNICSNEALCALAAVVYLSSLGAEGLRKVAETCLEKSHYLASLFPSSQLLFPNAVFFKEFAIKLDKPVSEVNKKLLENGIIGGLDLGRFYPEYNNCMLVAVTEMTKKEDMDRFTEILLS